MQEPQSDPDWKLCHAHRRSSVRTSNSMCTNENLGAHIFVQEVSGAHVKQTKIKLYLSGFQVLWSIMTWVCRCAFFFSNECPSVRILQTFQSGVRPCAKPRILL